MSIKTIQPFSLKKLVHRVLMIKSAAFIKMALAKEETLSECSVQEETRQNLKKFTKILNGLSKEKNEQIKADAFSKIQEAGWKLIPEVQQSQEEDSKRSSTIIEKMTSKDSTSDHASKIHLQNQYQIDHYSNKEKSGSQNFDYSNVQKYECSHGLVRLDTFDTLRTNNSKAIKMKKRRIIMKKIANIEACIEYLGLVGREELERLYHCLQI